jgi:hypothetical protein
VPVDQPPGGRGVERGERHLLQAGVGQRPRRHLAGRGQHDHRVVRDAAGNERQHLGRHRVEPRSVLGHEQHRRLGGPLPQQREGGQGDAEHVADLGVDLAERGQQRPALGRRQVVDPAEHGLQRLVQAGERQVGLGLHPGQAQHRHAPALGPRRDLRQQGRLADARLAHHDQRRPAPVDRAEHAVEATQLGVAAEEATCTAHGSILPGHGPAGEKSVT